MSRARTVTDLAAAQAMLSPVRVRMLELMRTPNSAAGLARVLDEPRQKLNYHLKELERAGFVTPAGERRRGAMTEQLYQSVATAFVVSPRVTWADERRVAALRDQAALAALIDAGERLLRDGAGLLDRAAYDGESIPSACVDVEVAFPDEAARSAFMTEYLEALGPLLTKYGVSRQMGAPFRLMLAVYPDPAEEVEQ